MRRFWPIMQTLAVYIHILRHWASISLKRVANGCTPELVVRWLVGKCKASVNENGVPDWARRMLLWDYVKLAVVLSSSSAPGGGIDKPSRLRRSMSRMPSIGASFRHREHRNRRCRRCRPSRCHRFHHCRPNHCRRFHHCHYRSRCHRPRSTPEPSDYCSHEDRIPLSAELRASSRKIHCGAPGYGRCFDRRQKENKPKALPALCQPRIEPISSHFSWKMNSGGRRRATNTPTTPFANVPRI
jgi:hypothetical protein